MNDPRETNHGSFLRLIVGDDASSASRTASDPSAVDEQDTLRNIGLRLLDLADERSAIAVEYRAAKDRMNEVAPLPPKPRPREIEEGKPKPLFAKPLKKIVRASTEFFEDTPADAYWHLMQGHPLTRKEVYQISSRYQDRLFSAARESGYADALRRWDQISRKIRQAVAESFEIEPRTSTDVAIQAWALLEAFAVQDGRAGGEFAKKLAHNAVMVLLPSGGGGSRITPSTLTIAA